MLKLSGHTIIKASIYADDHKGLVANTFNILLCSIISSLLNGVRYDIEISYPVLVMLGYRFAVSNENISSPYKIHENEKFGELHEIVQGNVFNGIFEFG